ncbi:MAG: hypothetical protein Q9164_003290 [Protoblastenia rupestris]
MHFAASTAVAFASLYLAPTVFASPIASEANAGLIARDQILARAEPTHDIYLKDDDDHKIYGELEHVFDVIEKIPNNILDDEDDAALDKWMKEQGYRSSTDKRDVAIVERDLEDRGAWEVAKCAGAIAAFIATNAIGAAKLLRIKKYIEALGGVRKSAELMLKASTNAERLKEGGEALALLAAEILGTSMISNNC